MTDALIMAAVGLLILCLSGFHRTFERALNPRMIDLLEPGMRRIWIRAHGGDECKADEALNAYMDAKEDAKVEALRRMLYR